MNDQAAMLRAAHAAGVRGATPTPTPGARVFVIGSGKGGVGKSVLSILTAAAMARDGRRVLLLDGAQNQGNLHVLLDARPAGPLEALLRGEARAEDLVVPVCERLWLVPGDSGAEAIHALAPVDRARLHHRLSALYASYDAVVVDAGPGIDSVVRVAAMGAERLIVVAVPEPASLSDAYALIKIVSLQIPSLPIDVLVNCVVEPGEAEGTFARLDLAAQRFLDRRLGWLGAVPEDDAMRRAARRPGTLLAAHHAAIDAVARRLTDPAPHEAARAR